MQELAFLEPGRLAFREAPAPALDAPTDALVRPFAVARCDLDRAILRGKIPVPGPFAFGHEFVAVVTAVGDAVRNVAIGATVVVPCQIACGACARCLRGLTGYCERVPPNSAFGLGPMCGAWGGALSDTVRVPFAEAMLVLVPEGVDPVAIASAGDNLPDAYRCVAPFLRDRPGASVLVVSGGAPSLGLYAVAIAQALGSGAVRYVDRDEARREAARTLGAEVSAEMPVDPRDRFPIVVDASGHPKGLAFALRSVEPGGVCTSVGGYVGDVPVPLWDMWLGAVTLRTGLVNARADLPNVLDLVASGRFRPERVPTLVAPWNEAPEAFLADAPKVVVVRDRAG